MVHWNTFEFNDEDDVRVFKLCSVMISNQCVIHSSVIEKNYCVLVNANLFASVFPCVQNASCTNVVKTKKGINFSK